MQMLWRHQIPKHEKRNALFLFNNLGSKQSGNEIWLVYVILQKKNFYQKIIRKM